MKLLAKLELTKEELEWNESPISVPQVLDQLDSYDEVQLNACFDDYYDIPQTVQNTLSGVEDILDAYKKHRSYMED
mgnify:CR=1 FL=1